MATINFGGVDEHVVTREEFTLDHAREVLKDEVIAVIGYGVQGPGQSLNLKDNGFNVIVGQRKGKTFDKAVADGWVPGVNLFEIEEACKRGTIIQFLVSDAAQIEVWPVVKKHLTPGKALYFSHGFGITYNDRTGIVPPKDVDVIMVAPKGSGTSLRRLFLQGRDIYSQQLKDYFAASMQPNRICVVMYAPTLKEAEKKYLKMRRIYTRKSDTPYDVRYLTANDFAFKPIQLYFEDE